ncbi:MAG: succinate dehydrogenase, hydrophobic membrane anchor protein [Coxiella sp. RIFCSPHIGHO2_12_FULL_42_15]|nr:MAG: succinate dehydrogenase, hydrophobic membrane anchor protein [Coxiella sp. RIFCSPHIGHO2_12_FULL_42_15]
MVRQINRSGLLDWVVQRCTAVIVGVYAIFLMLYLFAHPALSYDAWTSLFSDVWMRMATVTVLVSVLWHAWIGLWTVFTDYIKVKPVRLLIEMIVILLLLAYFIWVLEILWR